MALRFRGVRVPISALPAAAVLDGDEAVPLVQDDQTRQAASGDFITEIPPGSITNVELADMAQGTVKGRTLAGGTGTPVDLTPTELTTIVASILLPIDNTELSDMAESTIKGRAAGAGTGDPQDLTAAQVVTLIGPTDFVQGATFARGSAAIEVPVMDVDVYIAQACEIRSIVILAITGPGSCVVDIYRAAFGSFPPTSTIFSGAKPTISGGSTYSDSVLTGVSKNNAAGDVLRFHLVSSSVFQRISISLVLRKL